jgi:hypothetical protein
MKRVINPLIQWILLGMFALTLIFSLYLGADFYQSMNQTSNQSLNQRTILHYFNHRLNQADMNNGFSVQDNLLMIEHEGYYTLIYEEDGYLVEQVSEVNTILESSGQRIALLSNLKYEEDQNQVYISYLDSLRNKQELTFTIRSMRNRP